MSLKEKGPQISRSVGHPTADRPLGGRQTPDVQPTPQKKNNKKTGLLLGVGAAALVAGGLGYAVFSSKDGAPQPTQNPGGGIVEPSSSPVPTPFSTESPVVIVTPPPEATPIPTPDITPTPEATPELKSIEDIIDAKHPKVAAKTLNENVKTLFEEYPNDPFSQNATTMAKMCTDKNEILSERTVGCELLIRNLYRIYDKTGDDKWYKAALQAYNFSYNQLPEYNMDAINEYIRKPV